MKKALALLLLVVIVLSGCIGQPPSPKAGQGLVIQSFSPDFEEIRSGESITFTLEVENVGEADATDIKAEIFGGVHEAAGWTFQDDYENFVDLEDEFGIDRLRGTDPELGLEGEGYVLTWTVLSPSLRVDNTYTADARVYYDYSTSSMSTLRFYSYDYLKSLSTSEFERLKKEAGVVSSTSSSGPLQVEFSVGARPLIVYSTGDSFTLQIKITNVGRGNTFDRTYAVTGSFASVLTGLFRVITGQAKLPASELNIVDVVITHEGLDFTCSGLTDGKTTLIRGDSRTLFCTIRDVNKDEIGNKKDYTITVDLRYGYYDDDSTTIKVLRAEAGVTPTLPTEWECVSGSSCSDDDDCPPPPPGKTRVDCRNGLCCYR